MFEHVTQSASGAALSLFVGFLPYIIIIVMFLAVAAMLFLMGPEGRFFLSRAIWNQGGVDLLEANPLTGNLELSVVKWSGQNWLRGKGRESDGIWFGFRNLAAKDEDNDSEKANKQQLNEAMSSKSTWKGCHRSVLINNQSLNLIFTPQLNAEFSRSAKELGMKREDMKNAVDAFRRIFAGSFDKAEEELKGDPQTLFAFQRLRKLYNAGVGGVHVVERIDPSDISKFMKGQTAKQVNDVRDEGITIGQLKMTRPKGKPFHFPWLIVGLLIVAVLVIGGVLYLIQSGALNNIIPLGK